jgi:hypothetical protein
VKALKIFLVLCLIGTAFVFTSCDTSIFSTSDVEIKFDSAGHVKEAITYTSYSSSTQVTDTYSKDGSYEWVEKSWDGATSAWTQSDGVRGTYVYTPATRTMTYSITSGWNGTSYITFDDTTIGAPKSQVMTMMLGKHNLYQVAIGTVGSYTVTQNSVYWGAGGQNMTVAITVPADLTSYTMMQTMTILDTSGTVVSGSQAQSVYTIDHIFPSDVTSLNKAKGKTITVTSNTTVSTPYTWTSGTTFTAGTAVTNHVSDDMTMSVSSNGTFLAMVPISPLARSFSMK